MTHRVGREHRARLATVLLVALGTGLGLAAPAAADDVLLTNGRSFEGVIARVEGSRVHIRLPYGEMTLPMSRVERIDRGDSTLARYLAQKESLTRAGASAEGWLDLAAWARAHDLPDGVREAALTAAAVDPHAAGLAPVLRPLGYVFDDELDRWIRYEDAMRRRGFVLVEGEWMSREEQAERLRRAEEAASRARAERQAGELAATARDLRTVAEIQLAREAAQAQAAPVYGIPVGVWFGGFPVPVRHHPRPPEAPPGDGGPSSPPPREPPPGRLGHGGNLLPGDFIPGRLNTGAFPIPGKLPLH